MTKTNRDLTEFGDDEDDSDDETDTSAPSADRDTSAVPLSERGGDGPANNTNALELYCENRPKCGYGVSSMFPTQGYSFPSDCPQCGGDLKRAENYSGPDP